MSVTDPRSCAIHQPNFFPRLSTLAKLFRADVWVVLDDVQFNARDYQHRARLAPPEDRHAQRWLSVPVHRPRGRDSRIDELLLADPKAGRRVEKLIHQFFRRAPYWAAVDKAVEVVLAEFEVAERLATVAEVSTLALLSLLKWPGEARRSSEISSSDERSERLADLTRAVHARTYLCGRGGARYLDEAPFARHNLLVDYPAQPKLAGEDGMRTLSALWAFAVHGPDELRRALTAAPVAVA